MSVPFFDIKRQNQTALKELNSAIEQVVNSGRFILGENVSSLEKEIAEYCGVRYAIGVASGTEAALHIVHVTAPFMHHAAPHAGLSRTETTSVAGSVHRSEVGGYTCFFGFLMHGGAQVEEFSGQFSGDIEDFPR